MSQSDSTTAIETTHPNAETIAGLREVADWLEQHPELPPTYYASISFRSAYAASHAREDLTALAEALGDRAVERVRGEEVLIEAGFATVRISAAAQIAALSDVPEPEPLPYEPIIKRADIPVTDAEDDAWSAIS